MTDAPHEDRPTAILFPKDQESWHAEGMALAKDLEAMGQRPWFRVHYPPTSDAEAASHGEADGSTYDVLELVDGELVTAPSFEPEEAQA